MRFLSPRSSGKGIRYAYNCTIWTCTCMHADLDCHFSLPRSHRHRNRHSHGHKPTNSVIDIMMSANCREFSSIFPRSACRHMYGLHNPTVIGFLTNDSIKLQLQQLLVFGTNSAWMFPNDYIQSWSFQIMYIHPKRHIKLLQQLILVCHIGSPSNPRRCPHALIWANGVGVSVII